ncbi:unnamed protein product [Notodromas monacha]|uniref:beta-galactoside alpha-(2,6)-sialyltransferase n=1 Tax=Notodromas monacha TaxID=399045 RepID=A0A7R9GG03_9CRUS|nr:unnamed protein product [Notodromas monacha]CAG0919868.1 unnamed protein product [Notodromas monacha]
MNSTKISRVVSNEPLQPFFKFRAANPDREIYFLDPEWIWSIADILQEMSTVHLRTLAPSSGFIGSVLLMHFCDEVHLFEMIPSLREDSKKEIICRYHEPHRCEINSYNASIKLELGFVLAYL